MAMSRLLQLSSTFFLRASKTNPLSLRPSILPLSNLRRFTVIPPPRLQSFTTDAAASVDGPPVVAEEVAAAGHPWPEWDRLVEKLKSRGYFERSASSGTAEDDEGDGGGSATASDTRMELNRLKNGCLKFARERFDILSSLPKEDIRSIVECGCPNLLRKSVNSAKRLRAFLRLDEGDVCGSCNLRGSCDKAYIIQHEEGGARTVDVMRILLSYAVNPVSLSEGKNPSVKENVQESARKLLSHLIELSDTTIDPSLPKPAVSTPAQREPSQKVICRNKHPPNVEMKRGDWLCPNCNFLNFARNFRCLECNADGPKRAEFDGAEMKLGDWTCPQCRFMNFARNRKCFRCQEPRPKRELSPGDWECPSCDFINFRRNTMCLKCNCYRPKDECTGFEDHLWRRPKESNKNNSKKFGDDEDEANEDKDDDILPLHEGENKFVVGKRATLSERRLTSARRSNLS